MQLGESYTRVGSSPIGVGTSLVNAKGPRLLIVIADGVRHDVLADEIAAGHTPALAALAARGGQHVVTAAFPSVTGPAYVPFVMGRHPAVVGMPGLRWYDRSRTLPWAMGNARSYVGFDIWHTDHDVDRSLPTLFDLASPSLAGMMMVGRGATLGRVGRGVRWMLRAGYAHFRGDSRAWRSLERAATREFLTRFARHQPRLSMLGILSPDKFAHAYGGDSTVVRDAIRDIDRAIAQAWEIADRGGWGDALVTWVVGDHGHAPVSQHDDLHAWLTARGHRVLAHPTLNVPNADIALTVGGNAMAMLYCEPQTRARVWWPSLTRAWQPLADALLTRPSIELLAVAESPNVVRVRHAARGDATITITDGGGHAQAPSAPDARFSYDATSGDPLSLGGSHHRLDTTKAWEVTRASPFPDALTQLAALATGARSGDIVVSAAAGWDLRARFEPQPHVSTHGALRAEQMWVPLLLSAPPARTPQRTADIVPSALDVLGIERPARLHFDGRSFV
jgi:hypothetical protein